MPPRDTLLEETLNGPSSEAADEQLITQSYSPAAAAKYGQAPIDPMQDPAQMLQTPSMMTVMGLKSTQEAIDQYNAMAGLKASAASQIRDELASLRKGGQMETEQTLAAALVSLLPVIAGAAMAGKRGLYAGMQAGGTAGVDYTQSLIKQNDKNIETKKEELTDVEKKQEAYQSKATDLQLKQIGRQEDIQDYDTKLRMKAEQDKLSGKKQLDEGQKEGAKQYGETRAKAIERAGNIRTSLKQLNSLLSENKLDPEADLMEGLKQAFKGRIPNTARALIQSVLTQDLLDNLKTTQVGAPSNLDSAMQRVAQGQVFGASIGSIMRAMQEGMKKANSTVKNANDNLEGMGLARQDKYYNPDYQSNRDILDIPKSRYKELSSALPPQSFEKAKDSGTMSVNVNFPNLGRYTIYFNDDGSVKNAIPLMF